MADENKIIAQYRERFDLAAEGHTTNHRLAAEDLRFLNGDQWNAAQAQARERKDRPALTLNLLNAFVDQVLGEWLMNQRRIKVRPDSPGATEEIAQILGGITHHIERRSFARNAYKAGAFGAIANGSGFWRAATQYASHDSFNQEIVLKPIHDPLGVFIDPASTAYDLSDAEYMFLTQFISESEFKRKWPDAQPISIVEPSLTPGRWTRYEKSKLIRLAEYWRRTYKSRKLVRLNTGETRWADSLDEVDLLSGEVYVVEERVSKVPQIEYFLVYGGGILEGPTKWPSKYWPIIPTWGKAITIGGDRIYRGIVRDSKEVQRLYNYWRSISTEYVAQGVKAQWIGTAEQFRNHKKQWADAHLQSRQYLLYDPDGDAPPPQRIAPPQVPIGVVNEAGTCQRELNLTTGLHNASMGAPSDATSGKAIALQQFKGDTGTFEFHDNLFQSIELTGRLLIDLIPHVYTAHQMFRIRGVDPLQPDAESIFEINIPDTSQGVMRILNDPSIGEYAVEVDTGPAFATVRQEALNVAMQLVQYDPQRFAPALGDIMVILSGMPYHETVLRRLQTLMPPEFRGEQPQPDPMQALEIENQRLGNRSKEASIVNKELDAEKKRRALEDEETANQLNELNSVLASSLGAGGYGDWGAGMREGAASA